MISEVSKNISKYFVANGAEESDAEVIAYGAECLMSSLISETLLIVIGILAHQLIGILIWSVSFMMLRVNLGGLHARSHFWCIAIGTVIGASSLIVSPLWTDSAILMLIFVVAASVAAIVLAPVPHKNKMHLQKQKKKIKIKVAVTLTVEGIAIAILYGTEPVMASYIVSGIVMAAVLAGAGMIFNPR